MRRDSGYISQNMLMIELPGEKKMKKPQRKHMDILKKDMQRVGVIGEDARDRVRCKQMIACGDP